MIGRIAGIWLVLAVAGCAPLPAPVLVPGPAPQAPAAQPAPRDTGLPSPAEAADNFIAVVNRVEPVAEAICRERTRSLNCDYRIGVDRRVNLPPNAFQTRDDSGRPLIGFTIALIAEARNQDELAFILGHEAAHHIAGHIERTQSSAMTGALIAGVIAAAGGAGNEGIDTAQRVGATLGARRYSKDFELEADALGTLVAYRAGYDPERGAAYFTRIADPGNAFLGTHPPNAARIATVRRVMSGLR